ncbi:MAG: hypothetical protein ACI8QS_001651 [Planctomycetota bacterium]|jgi:hypothetical protein
MKRITIGLIVLCLFVCLVVLYSAKSTAATDIADATTEALGLETTFRESSLGILDPQLQLKDLVIANPEGFGELPFATIETVTIRLRLSKLGGEVIEIPQVELDGVTIQLIRNGAASNVTSVLSNVIAHRLRNDWGVDADSKRYRVERLVMRNVTLQAQTIPPGSGPDTDDWSNGSEIWPEIVVENFDGTGAAKPLPEVVADIAQNLFSTALRSEMGMTGYQGLDSTMEAGLGVLESAGGILDGFFGSTKDSQKDD